MTERGPLWHCIGTIPLLDKVHLAYFMSLDFFPYAYPDFIPFYKKIEHLQYGYSDFALKKMMG
jgi:hypothetical protein